MPEPGTQGGPGLLRELASVPLPTSLGVFDARAFESASGLVYLALVRGEVAGAEDVLTRVHSECLTGDAPARCAASAASSSSSLRAINAAGQGVLVYATGHEGRGIGLVDKLRSYVEQDQGADTVDANLALGLKVDARSYADSGAVLGSLGVRSVRLMTNNPGKVAGLRSSGVTVSGVVALATTPTAATSGTCGPRKTGWVTSAPQATWWAASRASHPGPSTSAR